MYARIYLIDTQVANNTFNVNRPGMRLKYCHIKILFYVLECQKFEQGDEKIVFLSIGVGMVSESGRV